LIEAVEKLSGSGGFLGKMTNLRESLVDSRPEHLLLIHGHQRNTEFPEFGPVYIGLSNLLINYGSDPFAANRRVDVRRYPVAVARSEKISIET
jgi:hypothetical protein